jgi:hypothetical protein
VILNAGQDIEVEMTQVTDPSQCPVVIHGTSKRAWESIRMAQQSFVLVQYLQVCREARSVAYEAESYPFCPRSAGDQRRH